MGDQVEYTADVKEKLTIDQVNDLSKGQFVQRFSSLYEHTPWVAEAAWDERPFGGVEERHRAFQRAVRAAPEEQQLALIRAHPGLAGKAAVAGELTEEFTREQASAGLDRLSSEEFEVLNRLNNAYWEKFGFPLIFAVGEHSIESILENAEQRLKNSREQELETALGEIAKIARMRLQYLIRR